MAGMDPEKVSAGVILEISRAVGVHDPVEILIKVQEITAMIRSLKESQ